MGTLTRRTRLRPRTLRRARERGFEKDRRRYGDPRERAEAEVRAVLRLLILLSGTVLLARALFP